MNNQELEQKIKTRIQQIVNYLIIYFPKGLPATEATFNFITQQALLDITEEDAEGKKFCINMDENNQFLIEVCDK